jgi:hypothetical protein
VAAALRENLRHAGSVAKPDYIVRLWPFRKTDADVLGESLDAKCPSASPQGGTIPSLPIDHCSNLYSHHRTRGDCEQSHVSCGRRREVEVKGRNGCVGEDHKALNGSRAVLYVDAGFKLNKISLLDIEMPLEQGAHLQLHLADLVKGEHILSDFGPRLIRVCVVCEDLGRNHE